MVDSTNTEVCDLNPTYTFFVNQISFCNQSINQVNLTLWGKTGEEFDASSQPIVALKGVKLSDFGGRSLGTVSSTVIQVYI